MHRRAIAIRGIVQGVGFRPFVYRLAAECGLAGFVKNRPGEVLIEVEGEPAALDAFVHDLLDRAPPLARIDGLSSAEVAPQGEVEFRIAPSDASAGSAILIGPDIATCDACLAELFDPRDRRHHYPFLNCTDCGPRLTIIRSAPYDRERTTMAGFRLCPDCSQEYHDPGDRRFHAQPTACPVCGPRLRLQRRDGSPMPGEDLIHQVAEVLREGGLVALKGLGGYHLACDARNANAVAELRRLKHRDEKPLAVMVADLAAASRLAELTAQEAHLLQSPQRPIVLVARHPDAPVVPAVAPGNPWLGLMLPYTPLHHLLLRSLDDMAALVMTSGNRSDEPIAFRDDDAFTRLADIADVFLSHDRPIHLRCDDSVTRVVAGREVPIRRSRGYAPLPVRLPVACTVPVLAVGGQMKNTFALGRGEQALLSHHLGDLDHYEAYRAFVEAIEHYEGLFEHRPGLVVHDLHPDYASTRYAQERPGVATLAVQHHHAHLASCLADNGVNDPVLGVTLDGTGLGTDGAVWGGEILVGNCRSFFRGAHLRYVAMPGGEQAIREPWRMALTHLLDAGVGPELLRPRIPAAALRTVEQVLARRVNCPFTSSAGRLFDAVAALTGRRDHARYEGQPAVELEGLAATVAPTGSYPFSLDETDRETPLVLDTRPLIAAVARDVRNREEPAVIARRFHATLAALIVAGCCRLRERTGLNAVALSGGVFANALLTEDVLAGLAAEGFRVYRHQQVPPGDGGLSLGQVAVAATQAGAIP